MDFVGSVFTVHRGLLNEIYDPLEAFYQVVNFVPRIVNSKRRPYRSLYPKPLHQGLRAVMACPDGNAPRVQHLTDIKGMYTLYNEGQHAYFLLRCSDKPYSGHTSHL